MDSNDSPNSNTSFASLVITLGSSAWIGLGKIKDPLTGEIKKDLKTAQYAIETLGMLREKTAGNLEPDEKKLLDGIIADLQANYAEMVFIEKEEEPAHQEDGEEKEPEEKKEG